MQNNYYTIMHQHFAQILDKLISTSEARQVVEARNQAMEVRKRFALNRLSTDT